MPRQFSDADKKKWLELSENGKSEIRIAKDANCDPRTVKRGIEETRRKQDARIARTDLLKEALHKHQDTLLKELDEILNSLTVPAKDSAVLSWGHDGDSIFNTLQTTIEGQTVGVPKSLRASKSREEAIRGLLKQHIKKNRLWKLLAQWEKAYTAHAMAKKALQLKTAALIEEKTGYKLTAKGDAKPPFVYSYSTGKLFFETVLQKAFNNQKIVEIEKNISVNTINGEVMYQLGLSLAKAPGNEDKTRVNLLEALNKLEASPEVSPVVYTYNALDEITMNTRQVVEQIQLLGFVDGQCEVCRRLGV